MIAKTFIEMAKRSIESNGKTISEEQAIHAINLFKANIKGQLEMIIKHNDMQRLARLIAGM